MASADGYFYMFDVNTHEGGICKLLTQSSIHVPSSNMFNNSLGKEVVSNISNHQNSVDNTMVNDSSNLQSLPVNSNDINKNDESDWVFLDIFSNKLNTYFV